MGWEQGGDQKTAGAERVREKNAMTDRDNKENSSKKNLGKLKGL